jgi:hypothetical protein
VIKTKPTICSPSILQGVCKEERRPERVLSACSVLLHELVFQIHSHPSSLPSACILFLFSKRTHPVAKTKSILQAPSKSMLIKRIFGFAFPKPLTPTRVRTTEWSWAPSHVPLDLPSELLSCVTRDLVSLYLPVLARPRKELPKALSRLQDDLKDVSRTAVLSLTLPEITQRRRIDNLVVRLDIDVTDLATGTLESTKSRWNGSSLHVKSSGTRFFLSNLRGQLV